MRVAPGFAVAVAATCTFACALPFGLSSPPEWTETREVAGVEVHISVRDPDEAASRAAIGEAFTAAERIGRLLSKDQSGSEIDILTRVPSHLWIEISPTTYAALSLAHEIAEDTDGAYDPTWTTLLGLWGLRGKGPPQIPRDFEIDMGLRRVDWSDVELSQEDGLQARRLNRRTEVDLGGLARGSMLDAATSHLRSLGVPAARASTAWEHSGFGGTTRHPWVVSVSTRTSDEAVATVELHEGGLAVASRGVIIETEAGPIHDRFDPRTGRPTEGTMWVALSTDRADRSAGYADAVLAMGDEGRSFIEGRSDLLAAIAFETGDVWVSPGLALEP
jgi:thiamine biosynthesis lipoprotein